MKLRLLAIGSQGDVQPYIALGLGLQRAGFDVSIGTTANFRALVEGHGLACVTTDVDMQALVRRGSQPGGQSGSAKVSTLERIRARRKMRNQVVQVLLDGTLALSQDTDVLVYSPAAGYTAPHVAEKLRVPAIPAPLQPYMNPTRDFPAVGMPVLPLGGWYNLFTYRFIEKLVWSALRGRINAWRRDTLGLPPFTGKGPFTAVRESGVPTLYGFSPTVLPKPREWGENVHVTGYWFLPAPADWQPPLELVEFLQAGPKPVYIGFGSMTNREPQETARIVFSAVQQVGVRAVVASGWGAMAASDIPANVLIIQNAPHEWLFPRMAAAVHHGGAGTTGASLRAGVPTVVVPFSADQPFWGKQVQRLGAGPAPVPLQRLTPERLASAIRTVTTNETMCQRAADLGAQMRLEDGVGTAVRLIEQTVRA
jgi:sterol 3beta-glucosyltransferase